MIGNELFEQVILPFILLVFSICLGNYVGYRKGLRDCQDVVEEKITQMFKDIAGRGKEIK